MTAELTAHKHEPMPAKAAAWLDVAHMRKEIFAMMFERYGNVFEAVNAAYVAMAFIEDGETPDMKSTGVSQPGALPVDEASAPGNAEKAPADSGAESERVDQEPCSATETHSQQEQEGAEEQSGSAAAELIKIGHKTYTSDQIKTFKAMWRDPDIAVSRMIDVLNVSPATVYTLANRLDLGPRDAPQIAPMKSGIANLAGGIVTLEGAIDWYETVFTDRSVVPSKRYPGSYEISKEAADGDSVIPAVVTRNALIAEINATRRRHGENPFAIDLNGKAR